MSETIKCPKGHEVTMAKRHYYRICNNHTEFCQKKHADLMRDCIDCDRPYFDMDCVKETHVTKFKSDLAELIQEYDRRRAEKKAAKTSVKDYLDDIKPIGTPQQQEAEKTADKIINHLNDVDGWIDFNKKRPEMGQNIIINIYNKEKIDATYFCDGIIAVNGHIFDLETQPYTSKWKPAQDKSGIESKKDNNQVNTRSADEAQESSPIPSDKAPEISCPSGCRIIPYNDKYFCDAHKSFQCYNHTTQPQADINVAQQECNHDFKSCIEKPIENLPIDAPFPHSKLYMICDKCSYQELVENYNKDNNNHSRCDQECFYENREKLLSINKDGSSWATEKGYCLTHNFWHPCPNDKPKHTCIDKVIEAFELAENLAAIQNLNVQEALEIVIKKLKELKDK